jgi:anti-sigma B factor antagonist
MPDQPFTYTTTNGTKDGSVILTLTGPFTLGNMFSIQNDLRSLKPECLIMDLTGVPFMDSAGLGVIMNYYVSAENSNRRFFLVNPSERVKALIEMTKVDSVLKVFDTLEAAQSHC